MLSYAPPFLSHRDSGGGNGVASLSSRTTFQVAPTVGYLANAAAQGFSAYVDAFRGGLAEMGFVESRDVAIEYRWAEGDHERLQGFAEDLVRRKVSVIFATGGAAPALAARAATSLIPIVFTGGSDPVRSGLVRSLGRPGGNATGVLNATTELTAKRLALLREAVPSATLIAVLINPANSGDYNSQVEEIEEAARALGQRIVLVRATNARELDHRSQRHRCSRHNRNAGCGLCGKRRRQRFGRVAPSSPCNRIESVDENEDP